MTELGALISDGVLFLIKEYGIVVGFLAVLGIFSLIGATADKAFKAFRIIFMVIVAIPAIIIVGLFNKANRKERKKELGEIRAFAKQHPDRTKKILYYFLFIVFVLIMLGLAWWIVNTFVLPFSALNEYSKQILINQSNFTN